MTTQMPAHERSAEALPAFEATVHQLMFCPLGDRAWRLIDRHTVSGDEKVLAYVELRGDGRFEAVWVEHGGSGQYYATLQDVLLSGVRAVLPPASKPVPIPHVAPHSRRAG